jgi:hypothetical protein
MQTLTLDNPLVVNLDSLGSRIEIQLEICLREEALPFQNLLHLLQLLAKRTKGKNSQSQVDTSTEYLNVMQQKALEKEAMDLGRSCLVYFRKHLRQKDIFKYVTK